MTPRDETSDLLSGAAFVAGLVLVPLAVGCPPGYVDRWLIQPAWALLQDSGLTDAALDRSHFAVLGRESWVRMPALSIGALLVLDNLHLFRNARRRDGPAD